MQQQPMNIEAWKRASEQSSNYKSNPHLRAILPHGHVGSLIGFGGSTIQPIQENYNVVVDFPYAENSKWGCILSVRGSPIEQSKVWYEFADILLKNRPADFNKSGFTMDFIFPDELVDLFILQDDFPRIATKSNIKIQVKHNCLMRSTERIVRVHTQDLSQRSLKDFEQFVFLITELVQENIAISLCAIGNIFYKEHIDDDIFAYMAHDIDHDLVFYPENR